MNIPPFYFKNGEKAENLSQLEDALSDMTDEEFSFHVNKDKNDFANWINDCLKNEELAEALRTTTGKEDTIDIIQQELTMEGKKYHKHKTNRPKNSNKQEDLDPLIKETIKKHSIRKKASLQQHTIPPKQKKPALEQVYAYEEDIHPSGITKVHKITAEAPHEFILKEFLFGAIFGLLLGLILMAVLKQMGVF